MRFVVAAVVLALCTNAAHALTLEQALARTVENNPIIQQARANLEQAAGRRIVLRATSLPAARVGVFAGLQGGERAGEKEVQPFAFGQGFLGQPLFHAGIPASYRRGNIEVLLAQQRLHMAMTEQLHIARVAYLTAAYNESLQTLGEAQRQRLASNVEAQADRYEAGTADRMAVTVARLLEQEINPRLEESRRVRGGALLTLAQAMGEDLGPQGQLPVVDAQLQFANVQVSAERAAPQAIATRPDLQIARLLVRAAEEDQRMIEAAYFPTVNFNVSGDYIPVSEIRRGSEGSARRSDDIISSEMRYGLAYSWRVVDSGRTAGAAKRQRAVREINEVVLARLENEVPRELTRLENELRGLAARHAALTQAATVSEQSLADVQDNLRSGLSSQLEYRTAEGSFLESRAGVLSAAFEQQLALADWDRTTGRYLRFSNGSARNVP
jgi:outer membrane protein TolC